MRNLYKALTIDLLLNSNSEGYIITPSGYELYDDAMNTLYNANDGIGDDEFLLDVMEVKKLIKDMERIENLDNINKIFLKYMGRITIKDFIHVANNNGYISLSFILTRDTMELNTILKEHSEYIYNNMYSIPVSEIEGFLNNRYYESKDILQDKKQFYLGTNLIKKKLMIRLMEKNPDYKDKYYDFYSKLLQISRMEDSLENIIRTIPEYDGINHDDRINNLIMIMKYINKLYDDDNRPLSLYYINKLLKFSAWSNYLRDGEDKLVLFMENVSDEYIPTVSKFLNILIEYSKYPLLIDDFIETLFNNLDGINYMEYYSKLTKSILLKNNILR